MMKRFFALLLCLLICSAAFVGCQLEEKEEEILTPEEEELLKGAQITMYLSEMIYDFDPANAYNNEAALKLISLIYEPTYYLTENGKLKSNLIEKYEIVEDEEEEIYKMFLHIAERAYWSDGTYVSANDFVYTWKRVLEAEASYPAAALLFDVKNARRANQGDTSIDNVGLSAPDDKLVEITFEGKIDYDQFLLNLTSYALAPLRENLATKTSFYYDETYKDKDNPEDLGLVVRKYNDWAKKGATMAASGPFKLRTVVYPDDPARENDDPYGKFLTDENGNYLYYRYGLDATGDATNLNDLRLDKDTYYIEGTDGQIYVYTTAYLNRIKQDYPDEYDGLLAKLSKVKGVLSDYATEPQNAPKLILERNSYYYKNMDKENWKVDTNVVPYRLIVDYSLSDEELLKAYDNGEIFYVGDIPMSFRSEYAENAKITDGLSTHTYFLNRNAIVDYAHIEYDDEGKVLLYDKTGKQRIYFSPITGGLMTVDYDGNKVTYQLDRDDNGNYIYYSPDGSAVYTTADTKPILGEKILENDDLRAALSLVIDREAIAKALVFAEAAGALVPTGVFESNSAKKTFRENGTDYIAKTANTTAAAEKIAASGIDVSKFCISLSYAEYDEVHAYVAKTVAALWESLGVKVKLNALRAIENTDLWTTTQEVLTDVKDDLWLESAVSGDYDVIAVDMVAYSVDPFSVLAPFATLFSGMGMDMQNFDEYGQQQYVPATHPTGFSDEEYDRMIEEIFAEKDPTKRTELLHKAEEYLMSKLPVIPIVYNQNAVLTNEKMLTNVEGSYYAPAGFTRTYLKGSDQHKTHVAKIRNTIIIVSVSVLVVAGVTFLVVNNRIKAKKREEEIARISAEHEAKLREIRPGSKKS